jgi:hypothetical protein
MIQTGSPASAGGSRACQPRSENHSPQSVLEMARSLSVRPPDAGPMMRNLKVRVDRLASPEGYWVAVVVRHIHGPEDVIVLAE